MSTAVLRLVRTWAESGAQSQRWGPGVEDWGQSREGVEHPDCLVEEIVFEPAGFGPETLQSPP